MLGVMDLGAPELFVILVIVLLLFGGAKLPKLARSLGQAQREFRSGLQNGATDKDEVEDKDKGEVKDKKDKKDKGDKDKGDDES